MQFSLFCESDTDAVIELFSQVFSASEGEVEGQVIGDFVTQLISETGSEDLFGYVVKSNDLLLGCVFFSRLIVPSEQTAFILSPLAVSTSVQGAGIGQQLIRYGLEHLKLLETELVFTYGDPAYYVKTDFQPISEKTVKAPLPLSYPHGWLAQSLVGGAIHPMQGASRCVAALNDPNLW